MPAYIEIAYDHHDPVHECILPNTELWFTYQDPETLKKLAMKISCLPHDSRTEVEVGNIGYCKDGWIFGSDVALIRLNDSAEEIWEISNGKQIGLLAVTHSALLVSDFKVNILD